MTCSISQRLLSTDYSHSRY